MDPKLLILLDIDFAAFELKVIRVLSKILGAAKKLGAATTFLVDGLEGKLEAADPKIWSKKIGPKHRLKENQGAEGIGVAAWPWRLRDPKFDIIHVIGR